MEKVGCIKRDFCKDYFINQMSYIVHYKTYDLQILKVYNNQWISFAVAIFPLKSEHTTAPSTWGKQHGGQRKSTTFIAGVLRSICSKPFPFERVGFYGYIYVFFGRLTEWYASNDGRSPVNSYVMHLSAILKLAVRYKKAKIPILFVDLLKGPAIMFIFCCRRLGY